MAEPGANAALLDDELDVWRHLIHMLCGERPVIARLGTASLRAPLEAAPEAGVMALPEQVDWFDDAEQNRSVYRFLALQLAGRREFGTYAGEHLARLGKRGERSSALDELVALAESVRVQHRIARAYPGTLGEASRLAAAWLARSPSAAQPTFAGVCDTLLALALAPPEARVLPAWLPRETAERVLARLATLEHDGATVAGSLALARKLLRLLALPVLARAGETPAESGPTRTVPVLEAVDIFELTSDDAAADERVAALSELGPGEPDEEAEADTDSASSSAAQTSTSGAPEGPARAEAAPPAGDQPPPASAAGRSRARGSVGQTYVYDEWDATIGDYRKRRCRVHEIAVPADSGAFFEQTIQGARPLLAEVRRQFERIRPERYRPLRGLEDGEDFDLNALTEARIETRAGRSPAGRIYTARTRQQRDVATLFLVDVSASTDQPYTEPGDPPKRRTIDTIKEALVVMSAALHELGDSYAIYGFSSHGPDRVEIYPVKRFRDPLDAGARARIGGIAPKNGTRMGAALRHAITELRHAHARARHLILLSDGFPQDHDYGPDPRSTSYGIEDTAVALREVSAAGATPFCITVDRAGHDYLRRMCSAEQYLVIDDVDALPRELPKIYRRVVRA